MCRQTAVVHCCENSTVISLDLTDCQNGKTLGVSAAISQTTYVAITHASTMAANAGLRDFSCTKYPILLLSVKVQLLTCRRCRSSPVAADFAFIWGIRDWPPPGEVVAEREPSNGFKEKIASSSVPQWPIGLGLIGQRGTHVYRHTQDGGQTSL